MVFVFSHQLPLSMENDFIFVYVTGNIFENENCSIRAFLLPFRVVFISRILVTV